MLGTLEANSAGYIAGYVTKAVTAASREEGRHRPFSRMSRKPGIGYDMMHEVAATLMEHGLDKTIVDVPVALQIGTKKAPLGRYLRRSLRKMIGRSHYAPEDKKATADMQLLRTMAWENKTPLSTQILTLSEGRRIQLENRQRGNKKRNNV